MSYQPAPGGEADGMDPGHDQPRFIGNLAMGLGVVAVLFALLTLIAALMHPTVM
ncbi:MAG: hypothetical protein ACTHOR_03370 [Devosia sp.]|nr:hypothetical protein [Devosiaceae bacterium]